MVQHEQGSSAQPPSALPAGQGAATTPATAGNAGNAQAGAATPSAPQLELGAASDKVRYLGAASAWSSSYGVQSVLIPWMVLKKLELGGTFLGLAQASYQLPLLLLPLFGAFAERRSRRHILLLCHLGSMLPPLGLAWLFLDGSVGFAWIMATALATGLLGALSLPARDSMVSDIGPGDVQRLVVMATGAQFCMQGVGFAVAAGADRLGAPPVLGVQALLTGLGGVLLLRAFAFERRQAANPRPPATPVPMRAVLGQFVADRIMLACVVLNLGIGLLFISCFQVVIPAMVRLSFGGGAAQIAGVLGMFLLGTALSIVLIIRRGGVRRPGRALLLGLLAGAAMCLGMYLAPDLGFWYLAALCMGWGFAAGYGMTMGRSIVQERSPEGHRARIMALFQLSMVGSAPPGNLVAGVLVDSLGVAATMLIPGLGMAALVLAVGAGSGLWRQLSTTVQGRAAQGAAAGRAKPAVAEGKGA